MTISVPDTRQTPLVATVEFDYTDLVSGVGAVACALPQNAVVTGGQIIIDTAFNAATSSTGEVGDTGSAARYVAGVDFQAAGATPLVPTGYQVTNANRNILIENTDVGGVNSQGAGRLQVEYIVEGRSTENFE